MNANEGITSRTLMPDAWREVRWSAIRDYGIVVAFVAVFLALSLASSAFLTVDNLKNLAYQAAPIGIMACGGTLVFIAGGFDLSVGAIAAIAGIIAAKLCEEAGMPVAPAMLIAVLAGLAAGIFNGLIVTLAKVNAFIATLASGTMLRGLGLAITAGTVISVTDAGFSTLGLGEFVGFQYAVWVWLGFALVCGFLLWRTALGRQIYAVGGNAEAARLAGLRVGLVRATTFAISGLSGGIAGILLASQVSSAQADSNTGIEFDVITAIVLGGTSLLGGAGAIWRSVLGAFFLVMIGNGFNLLNVEPVYQQVFKGAILLIAVSVDAWARRRRTV
jgi:ribose transport system permease protein